VFANLSSVLLLILLLAGPQRGTGDFRGQYFDPFPIGASWSMKSVLTGYITTFQVLPLAQQTSYACFTPAASSMMVDLRITKTVAATYWGPGGTDNVDLYIYKSAAWGPFIFMQIESEISNPTTIDSTTYFFNATGNSPYGMTTRSSSSFWGQQQDLSGTNTCHTPPASFANTWTTIVTQESRTTPVYSGPVNCATYNSISTTQAQEKWCFAADPRMKFPPILVELDDMVSNGSTSNITLQTTQVTSF
jgi:hypothetical protein